LLVYVSAWLKHYFPAQYTAAVINSQPMGFYAPSQLVQDVRKHRVEVRPVDEIGRATALMRKGDLWSKPSSVMGSLLFWLLVIVTLMVGLSALKVEAIDQMVAQFFGYMPRAFSAAIILIIGYVLAGFISRAVLIAAANSGFHYAKLLAEAVRSLLAVLILAMVMEQLQIAPSIVLAAFSIVFGGIVAALAIAFGVGGIDAARRVIERESTEKRTEEPKDEIEHI
jgi:hypothetical protein